MSVKEPMSTVRMVDELDGAVTALDDFDAMFGESRTDKIRAVLRYLDPIRETLHTVLAGLNVRLNEEREEEGGAA